MTTVLSKKGQIVLPGAIRDQLQLLPGEDFEVNVEDMQTIVLRRISTPVNAGLVDLMLACPAEFIAPPRQKDDSAPLDL
jgi:AbrB family looped-hinge helix DNA binding protein